MGIYNNKIHMDSSWSPNEVHGISLDPTNPGMGVLVLDSAILECSISTPCKVHKESISLWKA